MCRLRWFAETGHDADPGSRKGGSIMTPTRREVLRLGGAAAVAALLPAVASRASNGTPDAITRFTGGVEPRESDALRLDVPEIADNGGAVPVGVAAEGAKRIAIFADANPYPKVAEFTFGSLVPAAATIRIRLAETQNVIAVAEMADASYLRASRRIAVTVGGCG